jgi:membrane protease YdiL (CAAX protease family)
MDGEPTAPPPANTQDRDWTLYIILFVLIALVSITISLVGSAERGAKPEGPSYGGLMAGDFNARLALAGPKLSIDSQVHARLAVKSYTQALPWPGVYRRIGIVKQVFLNQSGLDDLTNVASPQALKGLTKRQKASEMREAAMWRRVYSSVPLTRDETTRYVKLVRTLNLGSLREAAVGEIYLHGGMKPEARAALERARTDAYRAIVKVLSLIGLIGLMGVAGIGGLAWLFARAAPPQPGFPHSAAFPSFVAYLATSISIQALAAGLVSSGSRDYSQDLYLALLSNIAGFLVGLVMLRRRSAEVGVDARQTGGRPTGIGRTLWQGLLGYCAAVPMMGAGLVVALILQATVFQRFPTQEHPIVPMMTGGGSESLWLAIVIAVVMAPIVEETMFRGVLFRGLRNRMSPGKAAAFSSFVFASLHPTLPMGFFPIFALGMVLATLREKTGSVYPGMIVHALNNGLMMALALMIY